MLTDVLKFIHLLFALGLLGTTIYCVAFVGLNNKILNPLNKIMLWMSLIALITGTLLVIPKHFTFHTPWIEAAYLFVTFFGLSIFLLMKYGTCLKPIWQKLIYATLIVLLICVVHDAVTKTTFLFF